MLKVHHMRHEAHFTILANQAIRDGRLSGLARSVLMELISRPPGWQTNADQMWRQARKDRGDRAEGRRAFRAAFAELEEFGYLFRRTERINNRIETVLHLFHLPQEGFEEGSSDPSGNGSGSGVTGQEGEEGGPEESGAEPDDSWGAGSGTSQSGTLESGTSQTGTSLRRTDHGSTDVRSTGEEGPSSSSAEVADITHEATPPAPKKKTNKSPEDIVIERTGCTPEEAAAVVTYINQQGDGRGGRIRSLSWWVENRDIHTLRQDLAMVRGSQTAAGVSYDSDPSKYLRSINGGGYRPYKNPENQDVYDEPLLPPTQPAKNGVKGGVRGEVAPQATYDQLADMPEEDALARFMFGEQPA